MHRRLLLLAAVAGALTATTPGALAATKPTLLPAVGKTLRAAATTKKACTTAPASGRGLDSATYRAPRAGFLTVKLAGRGDWDLLLRDASHGNRRLQGSQGFGGSELVQTWVAAGQRITAEGCRRSGAGK